MHQYLILFLFILTTLALIGTAGGLVRRCLGWPSASGYSGWSQRHPWQALALTTLLVTTSAWAADTKISALSATTDFLGSKRIPATNVINTSNEYWTTAQIGGLTRRTITGTDTVVASDRAKVIEITSGTFTLNFTAAATLADGHWFIVYNSGSGTVTLDPNGAETLDGQTTITLQAGVRREIFTNGTTFFSIAISNWELVDTQVFTAGGTWNKHPWAKQCLVDVIAAGGGGGGARGGNTLTVRQGGTGGGGGARNRIFLLAANLGASETITIGAAGTAGTGGSSADGTAGGIGGNSSFGGHVFAFGGGGGGLGAATSDRGGGSGGGILGAGTVGTTTAIGGGAPSAGTGAIAGQGYGGASAAVDTNGEESAWGGAAGGGVDTAGGGSDAGGVSQWGGAGGGAGGGLTSGDVTNTGGAGGDNDSGTSGGGGAGGTSGTTCVNGTAGAAGTNIRSGQGGGGGGSDSNSAGCTGGAGGVPGGGGGGGGSGQGTGGGGGAGGRGEIRVWCYG